MTVEGHNIVVFWFR